jgi:hypothetical protein
MLFHLNRLSVLSVRTGCGTCTWEADKSRVCPRGINASAVQTVHLVNVFCGRRENTSEHVQTRSNLLIFDANCLTSRTVRIHSILMSTSWPQWPYRETIAYPEILLSSSIYDYHAGECLTELRKHGMLHANITTSRKGGVGFGGYRSALSSIQFVFS